MSDPLCAGVEERKAANRTWEAELEQFSEKVDAIVADLKKPIRSDAAFIEDTSRSDITAVQKPQRSNIACIGEASWSDMAAMTKSMKSDMAAMREDMAALRKAQNALKSDMAAIREAQNASKVEGITIFETVVVVLRLCVLLYKPIIKTICDNATFRFSPTLLLAAFWVIVGSFTGKQYWNAVHGKS